LQDERYLKPVLPDDALIIALDELPAPAHEAWPPRPPSASEAQLGPSAVSESGDRCAVLQEQLALLTRQFASYRLAVEQTLDKRWGDDLPHEPDATSTTTPKDATANLGRRVGQAKDYYYESYAHNGEQLIFVAVHKLSLPSSLSCLPRIKVANCTATHANRLAG
jgi:type I protein arginine methyltransferase